VIVIGPQTPYISVVFMINLVNLNY